MGETSVPCGQCGRPVRGGDEFCEACGARVGDELKNALRDRLEASDFNYAAHRKRLKSAQTTIAVLSVLFVIGGIVFYFITRRQAYEAIASLADQPNEWVLPEPVEGATTVGELKTVLEREPFQVLGLNLFLAVVMLGHWIWSKRSVLPAIISALGIYVAVIVASALYDPSSLVKGMLVKVIVVVALVKGVQSALAARRLETVR